MFVSQRLWDIFPATITILPTYRCNAACEQCCFESNPTIRGRLSREQLLTLIRDAKAQFKALRMIVFSGGECFLIKSDLYDAIAECTRLGLGTRTVTNGFWGRSKPHAASVVAHLVRSGLNEASISTGKDHQQWVPLQSVVNAAEALVKAGIRTIVTVEQDASDSRCFEAAARDATIKSLLSEHPTLFSLQSNVWMAFKETYDASRTGSDNSSIYSPCEQLFTNIVATPHAQLASCCGLTYEHIPEMKLGSIEERSLRDLVQDQVDDLLKLWIAVDGPATIMKRLIGDEAVEGLSGVNHICQACAIMYKHPAIRTLLIERMTYFAPEILSRFNLRIALRSAELHLVNINDESTSTTMQERIQ